MADRACAHADTVRMVTPGSLGCEECLATGWCYPDERFVELPDQTPQRGPTAHFI
jgi:hypothetical protein